ncbi:MAG: hypothetical protein J1E99_06400 [Muribaculaceae bacterium]|nr:hypothetical protein [Muribaculaceae bacterium]
MKKYLNIFVAVLLSAITVSLVSCSKDDDEPNSGNGSSFTVNGESYSIHKLSGATSTIMDYGTSLGSVIDAEVYPTKSDETDIYPQVTISIEIPSGNLSKGQTLTITKGTVQMRTDFMETTIYKEIQSGKITVSEVSATTVILNFENLKMVNGSQTLTLDGKLSFEYKKMN